MTDNTAKEEAIILVAELINTIGIIPADEPSML